MSGEGQDGEERQGKGLWGQPGHAAALWARGNRPKGCMRLKPELWQGEREAKGGDKMHGGETAPRFNAPPSLCWSLRGVGPHPGGSHPQHPPALCMCCCCCFGCFGPRHRAAANQGGGKRRVQRGSWTPRTASAVAQAGGQGLLFHLEQQ